MHKSLSIIINSRNRKIMLFDLIKSIYFCNLNFDYEILVIDDCSDLDYQKELKDKYPKIVYIRNNKRLFLIKSRNIGWKMAKGEYIFFIDDDNYIYDEQFFIKALKILENNNSIGVLGCRAYYFDHPKYILVGPNKFNKYTGKTTFNNINKKDSKDINGIIDVHDNPNAFFTKFKNLKKVNGFSEEIVQTFSEADFCQKIRNINLTVCQDSELKVYHKSPFTNFINMSVRNMGGTPERVYYLMRNRFVFIRKYGSFLEKFVFTIIFSHLYNLYYVYNLLRIHRFKMAKMAIKGFLDGYYYMISGKLNNYYDQDKKQKIN